MLHFNLNCWCRIYLIVPSGLKQAANLISKATSAGLVLHPISCALAFVALVTSIMSTRHPSKALIITATITGYLGALLATIAFIFDCVLYGVARHELTIVSIRWGNGTSTTLRPSFVTMVRQLITACDPESHFAGYSWSYCDVVRRPRTYQPFTHGEVSWIYLLRCL